MPGLSFKHDSTDGYRFGFNNQEKETGLGDYYSFEYRVHDARLGRFLSVDPMIRELVSFSPYDFCLGNPVYFIDPDGRNPIHPITGQRFDLDLYWHSVVIDQFSGVAPTPDTKLQKLAMSHYERGRPRERGENIQLQDTDDGSGTIRHRRSVKYSNKNDLNLVQNWLPDEAKIEGDDGPYGTYGAPNDLAWYCAASNGSYVFQDEYVNTEIFHITNYSYSIYKVDENIITMQINFRLDENGEYRLAEKLDYEITNKSVEYLIKFKKRSYLWGLIKTETSTAYQITSFSVQTTITRYKDGKEVSSSTGQIEHKSIEEKLH